MQISKVEPIIGKISIITDLIISKKGIRKKVVIIDLKSDNQMKFEFVGDIRVKWLKGLKTGDKVQVAYLCRVSKDKHNRFHNNNIAMAFRKL